jgi:hypothetical protein
MVDQVSRNIPLDRKQQLSLAGLDLAPDNHLSRRSQIDDLIGSLANEYENRRARQVSEWENLLRQNLTGAANRAVF